jgi:hypothetical protein
MTEKEANKALIRSVIKYVCSAWELTADTYLLELQRMQNKGSAHHWKYSKVHTDP